MVEKRCFPWHQWGRWAQYEEKGQGMMTGFAIPKEKRGETVRYCEVRQYRICERCGKAEDEFLKEGPLLTEWTTTHA